MICKRLSSGIALYYPPSETETARLLEETVESVVPLLREAWALEVPPQCRVFVMTGWLSFLLQAAPAYLRPLYVLSLPLYAWRMRRSWRRAAGWTLRHRRGPAVGVKPPRLFLQADQSIGARLFIRDPDVRVRVQQTLCHELTHAATARLSLPLVLNEGVAMLAVDRYAGRPTVRVESLDLLERVQPSGPAQYRRLGQMPTDEIAFHYARGYWLTRFLEETRPGLLKDLLARPRSRREMEAQVAEAFGLARGQWTRIDAALVSHFAAATAT